MTCLALGQYSWTSIACIGKHCYLHARSRSQNHQLTASTYSPLLFCSCLLCRRNSARVRICEFAYSLKFCCDLQVSFKIVSHLESFGHFFLHLAMHLKMFICKAKNDPLTAHLLYLGLMLPTSIFENSVHLERLFSGPTDALPWGISYLLDPQVRKPAYL